MKNHFIFFFISFFYFFNLYAQIPVPINGIKESEIKIIALQNVDIIVSPKETIKGGTLIIEDGKIKSAGKFSITPKGALEIDMKGKTIVPSFIESYSSIGLPKPESKAWNPRPQLTSTKTGVYHWNEAIRPESDAASSFKIDKSAAENLQKMGFNIAVTHFADGIARGSGAVVALGVSDERKALLKSNGAAFFSFQKGVSKQSYPSSQMGAIALLRQLFYDVEFYDENRASVAENLSLNALSSQLKLPLIFKTNDKLEVFRAQKIANEFDLDFVVVGGGNEYQHIYRFQDWENPLILPINFPEIKNVEDPYVAQQLSLASLKHWELSRANPYLLKNKNVSFAITSSGNKTPKEFWENFHTVLENGLSKEDLLASLTTIPAEIFNLTEIAGTLENGKLANFSVFDKNPFEWKDAEIIESWSKGERLVLKEIPSVDIRGKYRFRLPDISYLVEIKGTPDKPKGKILNYKIGSYAEVELKDSAHTAISITMEDKNVLISFKAENPIHKGTVSLRGNFSISLNTFLGQGRSSNGNWIEWAGVQLSKHKEAENSKNEITIDTASLGAIWFPNKAFGFEELPKKETYVLRNATLWTNEEEGIVKDGSLIIKDGKIDFVGKGSFSIPAGATEINCAGLHVTSGIIDEHSHIAISGGVNEGGQANSAEVNVAHVVRDDDINIFRQLAGGMTVAQLLHGSANPIGGQSAIIKLKWGSSPDEMLLPDAPKFIKFALGENVKQSNWGDFQTVRFPQTRMGVEQFFYDAFRRAEAYEKEQIASQKQPLFKRNKQQIKQPAKDLELETILEIKNGERFISCHSYVQSEINMLLKVADSLGFKINTFTHILEGYKVADKMLEHGAAASTFSDWWGYKFEVKDAIPYNAALMQKVGLNVAISSDDAEMGSRLNQEAAKAVKYGGVSEQEAWKMVTLNPAKMLHLDHKMGSLKKGKDADIVIWTENPLNINAKVLKTFVDGELLYDALKSVDQSIAIEDEKTRIINKILKKE